MQTCHHSPEVHPKCVARDVSSSLGRCAGASISSSTISRPFCTGSGCVGSTVCRWVKAGIGTRVSGQHLLSQSKCTTSLLRQAPVCCIRWTASESLPTTRYGPVHGQCSFLECPLATAGLFNHTRSPCLNGCPCTSYSFWRVGLADMVARIWLLAEVKLVRKVSTYSRTVVGWPFGVPYIRCIGIRTCQPNMRVCPVVGSMIVSSQPADVFFPPLTD